MSFTVIAEKLKVSIGTVRTRFNKMIDDGTINIIGRVNPDKVGFRCYAHIAVFVRPATFKEIVATKISKLPEVSFLAMTSGDYDLEVDVRPEVKLPDFSKIEISVDDVKVEDKDVDEQLDGLRARFGTLHTVERAATDGDFVTIDLTARIDGEEVDGGKANEISYEVGSDRMIDGLDAALVGMSVGDTKTFTTQLVGQKDDEKGDVEIVVKAVKERELPEADDAFAISSNNSLNGRLPVNVNHLNFILSQTFFLKTNSTRARHFHASSPQLASAQVGCKSRLRRRGPHIGWPVV